MNHPTPRVAVFWAAAIVLLTLSPSNSSFAQAGPEHELRVGTFSRAYVVTAYYSSAAWKQKVQDLVAQRNRAAAASDLTTVDQLDEKINGLQQLAQSQLAGQAPLTNIYKVLQPEWPAIAKEAGVDVIVESPLYLVPGSALQDVTAIVLRHLAALK